MTCPLPPHHQSELALALEIDLVLALEIELVLAIEIELGTSARHRALQYHHISQSFDLLTLTTSVSHLTCPRQLRHCNTALPHWSVI